jgi:arabinofuranan 3-O-arabinosyltransferase
VPGREPGVAALRRNWDGRAGKSQLKQGILRSASTLVCAGWMASGEVLGTPSPVAAERRRTKNQRHSPHGAGATPVRTGDAESPDPGSFVLVRVAGPPGVPTNAQQQEQEQEQEQEQQEFALGRNALDGVKPVGRWVLAVIGAGFLALTFTQAPGSIEFDSRLQLLTSPVTYIGSTLHLWNQNVFGGTAQLGAVFLMPTGCFFTLTHWLHIPVWCAERIWLGLLLTIACWGIVRLAEALGIGNRWARVVAGLAYCMAPIVFTWVTTSVALLAVVFLPWVITPLVIGSRQGSPRRAAARSGVAIALMGGSNAAVVFAVLPLAVFWLVTRKPGPRRRRLMFWWVIAAVLAVFWWLTATVFVGKYGYNYLEYTETSITTTSTTSSFEALRGASFWLDYFDLGGPLEPGDWVLVSNALAIVGTSLVAALGLAGLCRRIPERLFLVASLAFGVLVIGAGYAGSFGGLFSHHVQVLLQGEFDTLRNVSKFSPDVALPLALGLAWMLSLPLFERARQRGRRLIPSTRTALSAVALVAVAAVSVAAAPYWRKDLYPPGGFSAIPHYWSQTGAWLDAHQGHQSTMLVPGSNFATYTWGDPNDFPIQTVSDTSVEWRNLIPIASNGYTQMVDTVEQVLDSGTAQPGLAAFLSREGIDFVVEQNDLDLAASGAPPPAQIHEVLSETPGLKEVASFGPVLPQSQVEFGTFPIYNSAADTHLRAVEIYRVELPTSEVVTYPASDPVVVSGTVSSLLPLAAAGVINNRAAVLAGDPLAKGVANAKGATWALTDGNQRRYMSFGSIRNNQSYLLSAGQKLPGAAPGVPASFSVVSGGAHQTVESPIGAQSVSASSFGSSPLNFNPNEGPGAAFDDNPTTAWVANATNDSIGQWIAITLQHPIEMSTISVRPLATRPSISEVTITTDRGSVKRRLPSTSGVVQLTVPEGESRHLKITIDAVRNPPSGGFLSGAGIAGIAIPGVAFQPQMKLPDDESKAFAGAARNAPAVVFNRPMTNANLLLGFSQTDDPIMARQFTLPKSMNAQITGYAEPLPGVPLDQIITDATPAKPGAPQVFSATSWLGGLPRFRPGNLVDGASSPWIAGLGDKSPSVTLGWDQPRRISSISLSLTTEAARPTEIAVTGSSGPPIMLHVPKKGGLIHFQPLTTTTLKIRFVQWTYAVQPSPLTGVAARVPVGLSKITLPDLDAPAPAPWNLQAPVTLACGHGPAVQIDGKSYRTSLSGTLGDLVDLKPMRVVACLPFKSLPLAPGTHSFAADDFLFPFSFTSVALESPAPAAPVAAVSPAVAAPRTAKIEQWGDEHRSIKVSAGAATYLAVAENYNRGWTAKLGDQTLKPVRLDGWQQGYVIPAGKAGVVTMVMTPDRTFRELLVVGGAFLAALLALALVPSRRRLADRGGPRSAPAPWLLFIGAAAVLVVMSGPLALVAIPLVLAARRWGDGLMAATAFAAFAAAGGIAAWDPARFGSVGAGAFSPAAQIVSVVALAAVLSAAVWNGTRRRPRHAATDASPDGASPDDAPHEVPSSAPSAHAEADEGWVAAEAQTP